MSKRQPRSDDDRFGTKSKPNHLTTNSNLTKTPTKKYRRRHTKTKFFSPPLSPRSQKPATTNRQNAQRNDNVAAGPMRKPKCAFRTQLPSVEMTFELTQLCHYSVCHFLLCVRFVRQNLSRLRILEAPLPGAWHLAQWRAGGFRHRRTGSQRCVLLSGTNA